MCLLQACRRWEWKDGRRGVSTRRVRVLKRTRSSPRPTSCRRAQTEARGWGRRRRRAGWGRRPGGATRRWRRSWRRCRCRAPAGAGTRAARWPRRPSATLARRRELAATPPPSASTGAPASSAAASSLATSWSTTASWNDAATSASGASGSRAGVVDDRGLQAREREVGARRASPAGSAPRPGRPRARGGRSPGRPGSRGRGGAPPCRTPRPRRRRRSGRPRGSARGLHHDGHGVAARHDQHRERRLEVGLLEPRRVQVRLEVVDAHVGQVGRERERLRRAHAHEQRAGEAGPVARGDRVEVARARRPPRPAPPRSPA